MPGELKKSKPADCGPVSYLYIRPKYQKQHLKNFVYLENKIAERTTSCLIRSADSHLIRHRQSIQIKLLQIRRQHLTFQYLIFEGMKLDP